MSSPDRVSVIGAGLMGHALALVYALGGHPVGLFDSDQARLASARARARLTASPLLATGQITDQQLNEALRQIEPAADLGMALAESRFVVEAVAEDLSIKQTVFRQIDRLADPATILATNSSALGPDPLAAVTSRPERVLVTHWFNPPTLLPLVEVVRGQATDDASVAYVVDQLTALHKRPVVIPRYTPGFVANRLQMAMVRECMAILDEGLLGPAELDDVLRFSLAPRWAALGCCRVMDLGNTNLFAVASRTIFPALSNAAEPGPTLTALAAQGHHGVTTGQGFYPWSDEARQEMVALRDAVTQAILAFTDRPQSATTETEATPI